tara:strand:+ start:371 stop:712 length:342 start_codon:yes stop_codon:yes gene_type:complete
MNIRQPVRRIIGFNVVTNDGCRQRVGVLLNIETAILGRKHAFTLVYGTLETSQAPVIPAALGRNLLSKQVINQQTDESKKTSKSARFMSASGLHRCKQAANMPTGRGAWKSYD